MVTRTQTARYKHLNRRSPSLLSHWGIGSWPSWPSLLGAPVPHTPFDVELCREGPAGAWRSLGRAEVWQVEGPVDSALPSWVRDYCGVFDRMQSQVNLCFTSSQVGSRTAYPQVLVATDVAARGLDIKGVPDPATSSYCSSDVHCGETWRRLGWWSTMMQPTTPRLPAQRKLSLAALRDTPSVLSRLWNMHDILQKLATGYLLTEWWLNTMSGRKLQG